MKCVFTPEEFLNIPVIISALSQPLDVNMPPSATVGDLKREVQRQLNESDDPDQVLCADNIVMLNSSSLRSVHGLMIYMFISLDSLAYYFV